MPRLTYLKKPVSLATLHHRHGQVGKCCLRSNICYCQPASLQSQGASIFTDSLEMDASEHSLPVKNLATTCSLAVYNVLIGIFLPTIFGENNVTLIFVTTQTTKAMIMNNNKKSIVRTYTGICMEDVP